jgi:putative spermidine/putrescine transport system ATP-binding protein
MTLTLSQVSFVYPGTGNGVFDIDLQVAPGELVAIIGASGSGKTTILKLVAGFETPTRGRILIAGRDVGALPARARNLGIVFQSYALFPHMSAWQNVAYPLKVRRLGARERRRRACAMLELVGLAGFEDRLPRNLSGGQQQRVALARALVFEPQALLLDEPLSALDAALRIAMRDEISRIQREAGITALHVTHDQEEALSIADRVAVVECGRLVQLAPPRELYDHPRTRGVAAFVGQANLWDGKVTGPREVTTAFGALTCDATGFNAGEPVIVLVRPERIETAPRGDRVNSFDCRLDRDRFLGSMRRFDVLVDGVRVLGETTRRGAIETISVAPEHVQLLPSEGRET